MIGVLGIGYYIFVFSGIVLGFVDQLDVVVDVIFGLEGKCLYVGCQEIFVLDVNCNVVVWIVVVIDIGFKIWVVVGIQEIVIGDQF